MSPRDDNGCFSSVEIDRCFRRAEAKIEEVAQKICAPSDG
jgi:hypothetical protein